MGSRVLSLWLPYLAIDRIRQTACGRSEFRGPRAGKLTAPAATIVPAGDRAKLQDLCPLAERAGLVAGMKLAEARIRIPSLITHPADSGRDGQLLRTLAAWCERYTPWVALDRTHEPMKGAAFWLDIASSAHLFGGEARLFADLLGGLRKKGITARAAIADHPGAAWAACRFGGDEQRIQPVNGARVALASLPVAALRLQEKTCARLEKQGLDRIEHLYPLPRQTLAARFGDHLATRLDQALGLIDEPIAPNAPLPAQQAQLIFAEPVTTGDAVMPLIERLLRQLCIGLEAAGLGARRLTLALYRVDNSTATLSASMKRPSRDARLLARRFRDQIDNIDLGFGLERAILDAVDIEPLLPESIGWRGLDTDGDLPPRDLASIDGSLARNESEPVASSSVAEPGRVPNLGVIPNVSAIPTVQAVPAATPLPANALDRGSAPLQHRVGLVPMVGGLPAVAGSLAIALGEPPAVERTVVRETPSRPLRLLRRPEPIEAIAPLPDEPPVLFRWRQGLHKVVRAQGPEHIAPDWWRIPVSDRLPSRQKPENPEQQSRDYFAVEDSDGDRFWLFREGSYNASVTTLPRWYLHGLFS